MPASPCDKGDIAVNGMGTTKGSKLGLVSGVYIPVCLNIMSILMFLRFGLILGQVGFLGILGTFIACPPLACSVAKPSQRCSSLLIVSIS